MAKDIEDGEAPEREYDLPAEMKKLDNLNEYDLLRRLKRKQIMELLVKVELGIASHQEHSIIARIIADNGLIMPDGKPGDEATEAPPAPASDNTKGAPPPKQEQLPQFGGDEDDFE